MIDKLFTLEQAAAILQINDSALLELVQSGKIPYIKISIGQETAIRFDPQLLTDWVKNGLNPSIGDKEEIGLLKKKLQSDYPEAIEELRQYSSQFADRRNIPKGYSLVKVKNRKLGFVYYVRYLEKGVLIPSRWCTHTNNEKLANRFAVENRETILKEYHEKKKKEDAPKTRLYSLLKKYYEEGSPYLQLSARKRKALSERKRKIYYNSIVKKFIPYLRKHKIKEIEEIDTPVIVGYQDELLLGGIMPQTVNNDIAPISLIFGYLVSKGKAKLNPCAKVFIKPGEDQVKIRGCYELDKLKGIFNKRWENNFYYMLVLMIYSTGMRNSEIERIKVRHIININGYNFIEIPREVTKTINGVRIVPLHDFVVKNLMLHIKNNNLGNDDFIFTKEGKMIDSRVYHRANLALAKYTSHSEKQLEQEYITFYSGRHFWKTMMNAEDLGEVEEYFMGHKVSSEVAKRYNHRDKQGKEKLLEKAKKVLAILDMYLFA